MRIPNDPFIGTHFIGIKERCFVNKVLRKKSLFRYHGPHMLYMTEKLESKLSEFLDAKYVLACSNGASALKLSCIAYGIGNGDEVIMSPFTFIASASSVLACGAIPKFVDIDETMNIDHTKIEQAITKKTKAIMCIHMQGQCCDMQPILQIAEKHNLIVIEDAAQAFGSEYSGQKTGAIGHIGAFSLQAGKTITCGEGGFLATNDEKAFQKAKDFHDNGGHRVGCDYPTWTNGETSYGENYKLTELQSAVALAQLSKIEKIKKHQKKIFEKFENYLSQSDFYKTRLKSDKNNNIPVSICLTFDSAQTNEKFIKFMNENGVPFNKYCTKLINSYDVFKYKQGPNSSNYPFNLSDIEYKESDCPCAIDLINRTAWFNLSASLKSKHIKFIIKKLEEFKCK